MSRPEKYLLSTRPLPKAVIEEAAVSGVVIDALSFISTAAVQDEALTQKIQTLAGEKHTVVFTSMNAVDAVAEHIQVVPPWKIYSIGNTTRQLIEEAWGAETLAATAENAARLGERLVDDGETSVVFFCGNIRRDELPNKIRSEGGSVEEVVVYNTEETPQKLTRTYDGILFFSPSAVEAFCRQNKPAKETVFFAIGKTTQDALRQHGARKIIVGDRTGKVDLTRTAIEYLRKAD